MKILLRNVRLSFPSLFKKAEFDGHVGKYEATFLIPKTDKKTVSLINDAIKEALNVKYPSKNVTIPRHKWCVGDGDEKDYDGYAGRWSFKAANPRRPTVVRRDKSPLVESDEVIYAGCYVNASVEIWIQDNNFGKRVSANLYGVQFVRAGKPFGVGDIDALDDFEALGEVSSGVETYGEVQF